MLVRRLSALLPLVLGALLLAFVPTSAAQADEDGAISGTVFFTGFEGSLDIYAFAIELYGRDAPSQPWRLVEVHYEYLHGSGLTGVQPPPEAPYAFGGLADGEYVVRVRGIQDYPTEYAGDAYSLADADVLAIEEGRSRAGVDIRLDPDGGVITGTVTKPQDQRGVATAYRLNEATSVWEEERTASFVDGPYVIEGLAPGSYRVGFEGDPPVLVTPVFHRDADTLETATDVAVGLAERVTGIDQELELQPGLGTISGTITAPPWARSDRLYAEVDAVGEQATRRGYADADGNYTVSGLVPGEYRVRFASTVDPLRPEYHADAPWPDTATPVTLTAGGTVDVDAELEVAPEQGVVVGTVRNASGGPVDASVELLSDGAEPGRWKTVSGRPVERDGSYVVSAPTGSGYVLAFTGPGGARTYHPAAATPEAAERLTLEGGTVRTIDAVLCPGGPCEDPEPPLVVPRVKALGVGLFRSAAFAVTVSAEGATPTGTITVKSAGTTLKTVELRRGGATILVAGLAPGRRTVTLVYSGDDRVAGASVERTVTVW